ncbi:MAG: hypothetical protein ABIZ80_11600 [Bryobacteraceae bacterium]
MDYPLRVRVFLLALNFFPLLHVASLIILWRSEPEWIPGARMAVSAGWLYLLPPALARLTSAICGVPDGSHAVSSRAFLGWWAMAQYQMLFNRLPFLEEGMRLVPGLYSLWLRLWGSRIGRLTFWSPGVSVLDRGYLDIGNDVVLATGVRLNGHVLHRNKQGELELALARIRIGEGATIGGYSLLTAGTEIAPGEATKAYLLSPPFTRWRDGKRIRGGEVNAEVDHHHPIDGNL